MRSWTDILILLLVFIPGIFCLYVLVGLPAEILKRLREIPPSKKMPFFGSSIRERRNKTRALMIALTIVALLLGILFMNVLFYFIPSIPEMGIGSFLFTIVVTGQNWVRYLWAEFQFGRVYKKEPSEFQDNT